MTDFIKMDIFFFIASVELVILGALVGFILWKLLRILKHVEHIAEVAGKEAENLREDAAYIRGRLLGVLDGIFSFIPRRRARKSENTEGEI
jgi:hypothetical protein